MQTIYKPLAGEHINKAVADAIALAQKMGVSVELEFNDTKLTLTGADDVNVKVAEWEHARDYERALYRNSPEYAERERQRLEALAEHQKSVNSLMVMFPSVVKEDIRGLVAWCGDFMHHANWIGIDYNGAGIYHGLAGADYIDGDFVGKQDEIAQSLNAKGRWVIGQFMAGLKQGHGWPDMLEWFARDFVKEAANAS